MLTRMENKVMLTLYKECSKKQSILISPIDLLKIIGTSNLTLSELDKIIKDLNTDGYFDLIYSDRHGEIVYCISLLEKGKGYLRKENVAKRNLVARFLLTICFAILSFLVGAVLKKIF